MRILPLAAVALAASVPLSAATAVGRGAVEGDAVPADTILWDLRAPRPLDPLGPDGRRVAVDRPGRPGAAWRRGAPAASAERIFGPGRMPPGRPAVRLGLKTLHLPWLDAPAPPGADHPLLVARTARVAAARARGAGALEEHVGLDAAVRAALRHRLEDRIGPADRLGFLPPVDTAGPPGPRRPPGEAADTALADEIGAFVNEYADLGVRVRTLAELGGDWSRYRPCQDRFQASCSPRLLPQLQPDLRFDVEVGGTITDRIHVDVDFDQTREFEAVNRINLSYLGGPDDIVREVEVGDVTFALPPSRYLTQGLPAGNFGFQARGQVGPVDYRTVWAEQKGDLSSRVFRLTGVGNQRRFVQEDTLVLDDADYADGQFFFLVPPELIDRYPHVDVLDLDVGSAPPSVMPGIEPIQVYRFEADPVSRQQVEGFIQADATLERGGGDITESGWFRYLVPGQDYFVHPSGLWLALRNPLSREEMLAVTYVTAVGDTVGDYNPEEDYARGLRPELRLLKATGANHQPGRPTWEMEMHNVYRVSSSDDVEPASVEVTISLGEPSAGRTFVRSAAGDDITFLRLLGLDRESPVDEVDPAAVYQPGRDVFQDQPPVRGTFVVFPTLEPFRRPPPLPSLGLTEEETLELLGDRANRRIYENPDPFERENGGLFRLTIPFRRRSEGVISSFSLGALGIRDGSERIFLGDRQLVRGVDYEIDYEVGQVRLLEPEVLFAATQEDAVRATWEQKQIFQTAPVSVFGFQGSTRFGESGGLNLIGLYRTEKTLVNRPTLGVEPRAVGLAGLSGDVATDVQWLDRLLTHVPGLRFSGASSFTVDGEAALSLPEPNTRGAVFVDDFDASNERPLSLLAHEWSRGSAPLPEGADATLPSPVDAGTLGEMVWQHAWIVEGVEGDSVDIHEGFVPTDVDQQIRVAGSSVREPGLRLTFGRRQVFAGKRWASVTTTLSQTGADLTKSEFLEFYVSGGEGASLVIDLGVVDEDAVFVGPGGSTSGVKENGTPWGLGLLDHEADPARGEIWGQEADQRGVWGEECLAEPGRIYRLGDERAVCTRGNGRQNSEDLDGDGNLDTREKYLRYVVELSGASPYLVRTRSETLTDFRLYRIPLEDLRAVEVGGAITEADMRAVKNVRLTLASDRPQSLTLARMRIIGARWVKRTADGILTGIVGDTASLGGRLEVTPVSRLTEGDAYRSPPGVLEELPDPTSRFGGQGIEFNEKSLALRFEGVRPGDRAEVYNRFPQRPRNFLTYREARLWVTARSGDLGLAEPHWFFLKVGTDAENFYLYRTRLPAATGDGVVEEDWLPEIVVDFDEWLDLRRRAEETLIQQPLAPGDPPVTVWGRDSTYAVVLRDRGRAPDLANVREMALGVWNQGGASIHGEVWIDELRLSRPVTDAGLAGFVNMRLRAADVLEVGATWSARGSFFRQLDEDPTYQTDRVLSVASQLNVERFVPAQWGVRLPLRVSHDRTDQDPTFLARSDVRADRLRGLRETGSSRTRVSLGFRKSTPTANPLLSALLDGLDANLGWFRTEASTVTTRLESSGLDARLGYGRRLAARSFDVVPGFLEPLVRFLLPEPVADRVVDARLRWTPERFSVGTGWLRHDNTVYRFEQIARREADSLVTGTPAPRESMESAAEVSFRPFEALTADLTFLSTRDLLDPGDAVRDQVVREALAGERTRLAGVDLGWETNRVLRTRLGFRPRFVSWLRHDVDVTTAYFSDRNANFVDRVAVGTDPGDTVAVLQRNASGERSLRALVTWDPGEMGRTLWGPEPPGPDEAGADPPAASRASLPVRLLERLRPVTVDYSDGLTSRFNRDPVAPGLGYQLGLGGAGDFRFMDGDTAAALTDRESWRLRSGVLLPGGIDLGVGYAVSDQSTLDTRSDRTVHTRTWPDLTVGGETRGGIPGTPVQLVSMTAGLQRDVREIAFGGASQQLRLDERVRVPWELRLGLVAAGSLVYTGSVEAGDGEDPTGDTERDAHAHRVSFTSSFRPPAAFADRLDRPVNLSLGLTYTSETECRTARFRTDCVAFVDRINRALSMTLGTGMRGFEVGLQASYNDRQSFVGQEQGSTQFQLGLFGQFLFEAGRVGALTGR